MQDDADAIERLEKDPRPKGQTVALTPVEGASGKNQPTGAPAAEGPVIGGRAPKVRPNEGAR